MHLFPSRYQLIGRQLPRAVAAVAVGGAAGAGARWLVASAVTSQPGEWPWATVVVNLVGCLAIGVAARRLEPGSIAWDVAVTGVLGGFTTMSALAVELDALADGGRSGLALAYAAVSLGGGVGAAALALSATRAPRRGAP